MENVSVIPNDLQEFIWGSKLYLIHRRDLCVHRLLIKSGGFSSIHYHRTQYNQIYVVSGLLRLEEYSKEQKFIHAEDLHDRMFSHKVVAYECHRFKAMLNVEALEIITPYDGYEINSDDIVRLTERGIET